MRVTFLVFALAGLASACVTPRAPVVRLANARGSIVAAEQLGADRYSSSAAYLDYARQEADAGTKLYQLRHDERARTMLARAEADADLALALAQEAPAREEAQRVLDQVRQLQSNAAKNTNPSTGTETQP